MSIDLSALGIFANPDFDYDEYLRLQEEEEAALSNNSVPTAQGLGGGLDWSENAAVLAWL